MHELKNGLDQDKASADRIVSNVAPSRTMTRLEDRRPTLYRFKSKV